MIRLFAILLLYTSVSVSQTEIDSLLVKLEDEMLKNEFYDKQKEERINIMLLKVETKKSPEEKYLLYDKIFDEYQFYSFDMALQYIEKNIKIAEELKSMLLLNQAKLKLGLLLVNTGRYKESIDALNDIERNSLPKTLTNEYYLAYNEGYSGLSYNTTVKSSKYNYNVLYHAYQDSLFSRLKTDSEKALRIEEKEYRDSRNLKMAMIINTKRLSRARKNSRLFSLITFERSLLYDLQNNDSQQKKYLILSAISDIKASVKDNASMGSLARIFFLEGDINRAHKYINFSYNDAEFYNSKLRFVNITNNMPLITKAYEKKNSIQKQNLQYLLIFISVLAVFLILSIYYVFNQNKKLIQTRNSLKVTNKKLIDFNQKLNASNKELKELYLELSKANEIKEHYIGSFLDLYSDYISKLDTYRKLVSKYVKTNQMNALLELSKSKQLIDEELQIFNSNFDDSFLHIHPNFVCEVNRLLKPEHKIDLEDDKSLNTSLRILALIKLGITSSSRIAKILRYSVNTIYNYRAEINKSAIDKNNFEDRIKTIK